MPRLSGVESWRLKLMTDLVSEFELALISIDRLAARRILADACSRLTPVQFLEKVAVPALERMGEGWEDGRISLSQLYMSGRICEELLDNAFSQNDAKRKVQPRIALTILEDYHLLGKRIVHSVLRAGGFEVLDYGTVGIDDLVHRVQDDRIELLLISTLMLRSALLVKDVRTKLNKNGFDLKIIVGGAPYRFDDQLWKDVGADAMCRRASEIIKTVTSMTGGIL